MSARKQRTWSIYRIRKKAEFLGVVEAPDREAAIKAAIKPFSKEDPETQKRLMAQPRA
jgi:hypothetical protein